MNKFEQQLHKVAQSISLSQTERRTVRENLLRRMGRVSAQSREAGSGVRDGSVPGWHVAFGGLFHVRYATAALALVLVFAGGGASLAAEGALPGELLYPVKVGINEELRGALTFSQEDKTQWATRRAERRLEEAEVLAFSGAFSEEERRVAEEVFSRNVAELAAHIERDSKDEAQIIELAARFEGMVSAHETILSSIASRSGGTVRAFIEHVGKERGQITGPLALVDTRTSGTFLAEMNDSAADSSAEPSSSINIHMRTQTEISALSAPAAEHGEARMAMKTTITPEEDAVVEKSESDRAENVQLHQTSVALGEKARERLDETKVLLDTIGDTGSVDSGALDHVRNVIKETENLLDEADKLVARGDYGRARASYSIVLSLSKRIDVLLHAGMRVGIGDTLLETLNVPGRTFENNRP